MHLQKTKQNKTNQNKKKQRQKQKTKQNKQKKTKTETKTKTKTKAKTKNIERTVLTPYHVLMKKQSDINSLAFCIKFTAIGVKICSSLEL